MSEKLKKVISWRCVSIACSLLITWLYLGEINRSLELTMILMGSLTVIHYIFETIWDINFDSVIDIFDLFFLSDYLQN